MLRCRDCFGATQELLLQDRGLTSLDSLEPFKNLKKLELKGNHIASLGSLPE